MKSFAEFFAGVGLVREGLRKNEWSCVWANDISSEKQETYIKNFGNNDFYLGDIWDIRNIPDIVPDNTFLYTASFPCTDLSVAGGRAGLAGKESGTLDALIEILHKKKKKSTLPKVVLLENVKGFLTSHKGQDVENTVKHFSSLGYYVDLIELDAIDFSAQSRPRVFLIAVEESIALKTMIIKDNASILDHWWSIFDKGLYFRSEKIKNIIIKNDELNWGLLDITPPKKSDIRLKHIIDTSIPEDSKLWWTEDRKEKTYNQMSDSHKKILHEMINSSEFSYGTVYRRMRQGSSMAELRSDGFAGCLRTPKGGSSKQIVIRAGKGNWRIRLLTPREYARLQGLRDSFSLPEKSHQAYFAMGDAVCVPVIEFISENILEKLYLQSLDNSLEQQYQSNKIVA